MKKTWKRLLAIGTALAMLSSLPGIPVFAEGVAGNPTEMATEIVSEDTTEAVEEEKEPAADSSTEEEASTSEEVSETVVLNYVYIENTELSQGVEQTIAVNIEGIETFADQIQDIRLGYQVNGREETIAYSEIDDNLIIFRQRFWETGTYQLDYMEIQKAEKSERLVFADWEVQASFLVDEAEEVWDEPMLMDEMPLSAAGGDMAELMTEVFPQNAGDGKVVVVLDPGHDAKHCGAAGNGLREEELTLRIAQYCNCIYDKK